MNLFTQLFYPASHHYYSRRSHRQTGLCLLVCILFSTSLSIAQDFPTNFTQVAVASGLNAPSVVIPAPDGRLFIAQQDGTLRIVKNGNLLATPFIQLTVDSNGERGLLGITFDPDFTTNQYVYLYYTVPTSGTVTVHNRISRFTTNGDVALTGSETVVLNLDPLSGATNHNGGSIVFGLDKKLYIGVGENANPPNSQNLDNYLGKVLRVNPDGTVPSGNPFTTGSEARKRIWAYGLRNPYTLAVQPGTGRFFVNDVGQSTWEEINDATTGGLNFGWPTAEGASNNPAFTNPVYAYQHGNGIGIGCAITGGTFYNPTTTTYPPEYVGRYFFQDYCNNWIDMLDFSGPTVVRSSFATGLPSFSVGITLGTDSNLYYISRGNGVLYKIIYLGETCQTVRDGAWHDATVWSCGRVPIITDKTIVRHSITIGSSLVGQAKQINYETGGQVLLASSGKLQLGL